MATENEKNEAEPTTRLTGLVLLAHGSYDPKWLGTCERLLEDVKSVGVEVDLAYLQMARPTLPAVAQRLWKSGVHRLVVIPIFFSSGGHVANDIPPLVEQIRESCPELKVEVRSPVGEDPRFSALVVELSREALS